VDFEQVALRQEDIDDRVLRSANAQDDLLVLIQNVPDGAVGLRTV
jgi:hypothetical protein